MKKKLKDSLSKRSSTASNFAMSASIRGLHIHREETIQTQSQATVYSQRTVRTTTTDDYDFNDDFDKEEAREIFLSEQQEKVINKILEIARKGKINSKNAFDIPLKLADNDNYDIKQSRFWKIASQLLGASINIFDKRIQNTWISTNQIHEKLSRLHMEKGHQRMEDSQNQNDNNSQENGMIFLSLDQFRSPELLDNNSVIGENTLQEPCKLDNTKYKKVLLTDPLFQQKIGAFDNNSMKGLLLNVFSVGANCQVELFANKEKSQKFSRKEFINNFDSLLQVAQKADEDFKKNQSYFDIVRSFRNDYGLKKEKHLDKDSLGFLKNENNAVETFDNEFEKYFELKTNQNSNDFPNFAEEIIPFQSNYQPSELQTQTNFGFNSQPETYPFHSLQCNDKINSLSEDQYPESQATFNQSFHSVMTPWQLQFKLGKIQKKKLSKKVSSDRQKIKKREKIEPNEVDFNFLVTQNLSKVLKRDKKELKEQKKKKNSKTKTDNLISQHLVVYEKFNFNKGRTNRLNYMQVNSQGISKVTENISSNVPQFLAEPSILQINNSHLQTKQQQPINQLDQLEQNRFSERGERNISSIWNIRKMKKTLFQEIKDSRELRISQLEMEIKPANALITFLHLANQKNLVVRNESDQSDVILSWD